MNIPTSPTIVVVEDDPMTGWMLGKLLELLAPAYQVTAHTDGREALAFLADGSARCVITDYYLPTIDSIALIKRMVAEWPQIPVVVATAEKQVVVQSRLLENGLEAIPVIEKPLTIDAIHMTILPLLSLCNEKAVGSLKGVGTA